MEQSYTYKVYGLTVSSCFNIPELANYEGVPQVNISFGKVPHSLNNPVEKGVRFQASPGEFLLKIDNVAWYYVLRGEEIIIEPFNGASKKDIRVFLLGSVFAALLHQRNYLVLHGSAVEVKGKAVIFTGVSGAGKSTLAASLCRRGYKLITDDLCAVKFSEEGIPQLMPGFPNLKLWADSAKALGQNIDSLTAIRDNLEKYRISAEDSFSLEAMPISRMYILNSHNNSDIKISKLEALKKLEAIINNTYRLRFVKGQLGKAIHFKQCGKAAKYLQVYNVFRPKIGFMIDELTSTLEEELKAL